MNDKWDKRFLEMCKLVAQWSKDPSTKCGAVVVRPDKTVASLGYNGFPKGCSDRDDIYRDRETKYGRIIHAEVNAVLSARERLDGYTIYSLFPPCDRCASVIIQAGIERVVTVKPDGVFDSRWLPANNRAQQMYHESTTIFDIYAKEEL